MRLGYPWGRRLLPMAGLVLAGGLLLWGAHVEHAHAAVALLTICQGLVMSVEGPFWASMIEVTGEDAGAAGGILNMAPPCPAIPRAVREAPAQPAEACG